MLKAGVNMVAEPHKHCLLSPGSLTEVAKTEVILGYEKSSVSYNYDPLLDEHPQFRYVHVRNGF